MSLYVLRLRDGNCIIVDAPNEDSARERAKPLAASEVATACKLEILHLLYSRNACVFPIKRCWVAAIVQAGMADL